jgi:hypothetical protein
MAQQLYKIGRNGKIILYNASNAPKVLVVRNYGKALDMRGRSFRGQDRYVGTGRIGIRQRDFKRISFRAEDDPAHHFRWRREDASSESNWAARHNIVYRCAQG